MPDGDQALGRASMYDRMFTPPPQIDNVLDLPTAKGIARSRAIEEGLPPGALEPTPTLNPSEQRVVDALVKRFAEWARNTNITAAQPAHASPGYWSNPVDISTQYTLAAAAGSYVTPTGMSYTAPNGRSARIAAYGFDVDGSFTYDGTILWQFLLNGQPVISLQNIANHRGSMVQPASTFIIVPQGQTLQMQVRRTALAGGPSVIDMRFTGWDWSLRRNVEGTKSSVLAY